MFCRVTSFVLVFSLVILAGCDQNPTTAPTQDTEDDVAVDQSKLQTAIEVQDQVSGTFLEKSGIVGVGTGIDSDGNPRIVVYGVSAKKAKAASHGR